MILLGKKQSYFGFVCGIGSIFGCNVGFGTGNGNGFGTGNDNGFGWHKIGSGLGHVINLGNFFGQEIVGLQCWINWQPGWHFKNSWP